jgi:hypothetical protein
VSLGYWLAGASDRQRLGEVSALEDSPRRIQVEKLQVGSVTAPR